MPPLERATARRASLEQIVELYVLPGGMEKVALTRATVVPMVPVIM